MNIPYNYIFEVAKQYHPEAELSILGDKIIWIKPENAPINDEQLLYKANLLAQKDEYRNQRREKYPPLVEQLDMLWHSIDNGSLDKESDFYKAIKAVKEEFPKP